VDDLVRMVPKIDHEVVIVPAALSDFAPKEMYEGKIPSEDGFKSNFVPVPKVLPLIRERCHNVIGFKAESGYTDEQLVERARTRINEYDLRATIANDIDAAGKVASKALLVTTDSVKDISGSKIKISDTILDFCSENL
jgi:phosphopantothenoylcysteine decarboxylase/phosphopantothenate--cysteine ligase